MDGTRQAAARLRARSSRHGGEVDDRARGPHRPDSRHRPARCSNGRIALPRVRASRTSRVREGPCPTLSRMSSPSASTVGRTSAFSCRRGTTMRGQAEYGYPAPGHASRRPDPSTTRSRGSSRARSLPADPAGCLRAALRRRPDRRAARPLTRHRRARCSIDSATPDELDASGFRADPAVRSTFVGEGARGCLASRVSTPSVLVARPFRTRGTHVPDARRRSTSRSAPMLEDQLHATSA